MSKEKSHEDRKHDVNPKSGLYVKRDSKSGKFLERSGNEKSFKGVRKEALDKLSSTLNKLAKYDKK
jgi:hypothetical protein